MKVKNLIILLIALLVCTIFVNADTKNIDNEIRALDQKITKVQSTYDTAKKEYDNIVSKYPAYSIMGEIVADSPSFIVAGGAVGFGPNATKDVYIKITNPEEGSKFFGQYFGTHYYLSSYLDNYGNSIKVFGPQPKEVGTLKKAMDAAKADLDNLLLEREELQNLKLGIVTIKLKDGSKYVGKVNNSGIFEGKGKLIKANGDIYEGDFKNGVFEGKGKYTWLDKSYYEGDFKNGFFDGQGKEFFGYNEETQYDAAYYTNVYEGSFKNNKFHGKGKLIHKASPALYGWDSDFIYEGEYKDGMANGYGTLYDSDRRIIKQGNWINGKFQENSGDTTNRTEESQAVPDGMAQYNDNAIGFFIYYPISWGEPKIVEDKESGFGMKTVFFNNDLVQISSYGSYLPDFDYERYLNKYGFTAGIRTEITVENALKAYTGIIEKGNTRIIRYIYFKDGEACNIDFVYKDISKANEAQTILNQFNDMLKSFKLDNLVG